MDGLDIIKDEYLRKEAGALINGHEKIRTCMIAHDNFQSIEPSQFTAPGIHMVDFLVCLEPKSQFYGIAYGTFIHESGKVLRVMYNIHTPHSKGPHRSNTIKSIEQVVWRCIYGHVMVEYRETDFGKKAFWFHTPMDCLDEEARSLRILEMSLQAYCREEDLCKRLRKTDKAHLEWEHSRSVNKP